jgi:hypothetical protein
MAKAPVFRRIKHEIGSGVGSNACGRLENFDPRPGQFRNGDQSRGAAHGGEASTRDSFLNALRSVAVRGGGPTISLR